MKIFYICYEDLSIQAAWTTHVKEVVENLHNLDNKIFLFYPNIGKLKTAFDFKKISIPTLRIKILGEYFFYILLFFYLLLYQLKEKADVIYLREMSCCLSVALISKIFSVPLVLEVNGAILKERKFAGESKAKIAIFKQLQWLNLLFCHKIVIVAGYLKSYLLENYRINAGKITIIENGVNTELFKPMAKEEVREHLGLSVDCFYLAYVGSFYPHHCSHPPRERIPTCQRRSV